MRRIAAVLAMVCLLAVGASADVPFLEGFEVDTSGWDAAYLQITRVPSGGGVLAVPSSSGNYHAEILNLRDGYSTGVGMAGYAWYGGRVPWPGAPFFQAIDLYVDVNWTPSDSGRGGLWIDMTPNGTPFNYDSESSFNLRLGSGTVDVHAHGTPTPMAQITSSGWYTFEMIYSRAANPLDPLIIDLTVYDSAGNVLGTAQDFGSLTYPSYTLEGNGYVWITVWYNGFADDIIAIDNVETGFPPPPCEEVAVAVKKDGCVKLGKKVKLIVGDSGDDIDPASILVNGNVPLKAKAKKFGVEVQVIADAAQLIVDGYKYDATPICGSVDLNICVEGDDDDDL